MLVLSRISSIAVSCAYLAYPYVSMTVVFFFYLSVRLSVGLSVGLSAGLSVGLRCLLLAVCSYCLFFCMKLAAGNVYSCP